MLITGTNIREIDIGGGSRHLERFKQKSVKRRTTLARRARHKASRFWLPFKNIAAVNTIYQTGLKREPSGNCSFGKKKKKECNIVFSCDSF